jgi:hypothetical protein
VRAGAADASLTANAGLAAVTELCGRLGVVEELAAVRDLTRLELITEASKLSSRS